MFIIRLNLVSIILEIKELLSNPKSPLWIRGTDRRFLA